MGDVGDELAPELFKLAHFLKKTLFCVALTCELGKTRPETANGKEEGQDNTRADKRCDSDLDNGGYIRK